MRLIQALVPGEHHDEVVRLLEQKERSFILTEAQDAGFSLTVPVPKGEVEDLLEQLRDAGLERDGYVAVLQPQVLLSDHFDREEEAVDESDDTGEDRIAREEIIAAVRDLMHGMPQFLSFSVLSAVVATAGLLMNSPAVVVGSMVIAPLLGPAMASSVATVTRDRELFKEGILYQFAGVSVAVLGATLFGVLARYTVAPQPDLLMIPEVVERAYPGVLALTVALASGVAGALALTSGVSSALVGVMIAVALIPPTAAIGLGLAYADPVLLAGATVLVLVNVLSINLAGLVTLWIRGYRPEKWWEESAAQWDTLRWGSTLVAVILAVSTFLGYTTYQELTRARFSERVRSVLDDHPVRVLELKVNYAGRFLSGSVRRVHVRVSSKRRGLADELHRAIVRDTGEDVPVEVIYETLETAGSSAESGGGSDGSGDGNPARPNSSDGGT